MNAAAGSSGRPGPRHWAMFFGCVGLWGAAYAVVRGALAEGASPSVIVAARLWMATGVLHLLLTLPLGLGAARGPYARGVWPRLLVMGLMGAALPLFLLGLAQRFIDSGLTGILSALTPLMVAAAAPLVFASERMTVARALGFGLGFAGVVALMGPEALGGLGGPGLLGQAAAAAAAVCYTINTLVARAGPAINPIEASAGWTLFGALIATPLALASLAAGTAPSLLGWGLIALLALGPTALAGVMHFRLLREVGPLFVTQTNYLIPVCAVGLGALIYGERLSANAALAFGLIALGLFVAQEGWRGLKLSRWRGLARGAAFPHRSPPRRDPKSPP